ncbi:helix-turn-helix domain-containing protein [Paenibacillus wynnii]|uniref:helix-turn-helix domain-containing protein n=1 Tax=Paenibacillus wynnii TaxID=268407 RepID=UPI00068F2384|nr:helix-turn-helix domain-containing protein [Paenibacillus wynnii]
MFNLSELYYPLTAKPAHTNEFLPCKALQPYIRCFWGPESSLREPQTSTIQKEVIIPDTCMDIIWELDEAVGRPNIYFCGINDTPFEIMQENMKSGTTRFAIRFHIWAVQFFADHHLRDVLNVSTDVEHYFSSFRKDLGDLLAVTDTMSERIAAAEAYLLQRLEGTHRTNDSLMNAVHMIIKHKGVVTAEDLEISSGLSRRQLERLFQEYIGVAPKKSADLVRFQNVWQDLYYSPGRRGRVQDIVFAYQYSHQSHLINNFKKYAGRTPMEALTNAGR